MANLLSDTTPAGDQTSANLLQNSFGGATSYFTAQDKQLSFLGSTSTPYTVLRPNGNGVVDVYKDMYWSNLGDKSEVPQIFITEKELQYGAWATQLSNLLVQGGNFLASAGGNIANAVNKTTNAVQNVDSYVQLYAAKPTGFYYNFPWLLKSGDGLRSITNSWQSIQGLGDLLGSLGSSGQGNATMNATGAGIGAVAGALTPGFGFEDTKQYAETSPQEIVFSFPLYNTLDLQSAFRHFSFVNLFTFQNLKTRTSLMTYIPPKIYEVDAYAVGGLYMAAAYVSDLKIESIGTTRAMSEWYSYGSSNVIMPEAYKVTIKFTDLLSQSSNVFAGALGGTKIQVSNAVGPLQGLQEGVNTAFVKPATDFIKTILPNK